MGYSKWFGRFCTVLSKEDINQGSALISVVLNLRVVGL
jgi:hypothetical protein